MKILIVIDDYFNKSNGMSISTQRFVKQFSKMGQDVRVLASIAGGEPDYPLSVMTIPIFKDIIAKEGFHFAKPEKAIIKKAVKWADLVHLEDPFPVCSYAGKIAKELKKPITGTFHLYPENLTASVPILDHPSINSTFMKIFRDTTFNYCNYLQCPTTKVKQRLQKYNFRSKLVVISNGISNYYLEDNQRNLKSNSFTILSIGRFSNEKDQKTLIKAISLSKYKDKIHLILAGKGPLKSEYIDLCHKLNVNAHLAFYNRDELKHIMNQSSIVVHCANVEVEGMACMEAFATGCVPVIAESPLSSTSAYALSPQNRFPAGSKQILAKRIDYWITHPQDLKTMSANYQNYAKSLSIENSARKVLTMFEKAQKNYVSN